MRKICVCFLFALLLFVRSVVANEAMPGEIIFGKKDAPIVIHSYTAFTCGHCASFHKNIMPMLKPYIDSGKIMFVFRHFPIDLKSLQATRIVMAASPLRQSAMIDTLFAQQEKWINMQDPSSFFANISGIDVESCKKMITDKKSLESAAESRVVAEKKLNIEGTPYFVINGRIIDHAPEWSELEKYIKVDYKQ